MPTLIKNGEKMAREEFDKEEDIDDYLNEEELEEDSEEEW